MIKNALVFVVLAVLGGAAFAGQIDALASCYDARTVAPSRDLENEFFLVIDQTTLFDGRLKQSVADNISPFLSAGNAFSITQFSAFNQGRYTETLVSGKLDFHLSADDRDKVSKVALKKLDRCLSMQQRQAYALVGSAMKSAFDDSSSGLLRSDILASMKDVSRMVKQSKANRKIVLIASDMLENSSITSFYAKNAVRIINVDKELQNAEKNQAFGDFGGAEIYIIGAGLLAEDAKLAKGIYRSPQVIQALSQFWGEYFRRSNARLVEFGHPALMSPIRK